jgi:hypothetical protein
MITELLEHIYCFNHTKGLDGRNMRRQTGARKCIKCSSRIYWIEGLTSEFQAHKLKLNSMVWVRERTIPTERQPIAGEVIANFCGKRVPRGQRDGSLRPYSLISRQEPLLFYQVAPQLYSRGWVDPVPDPLLFFLVVPGIELGPPGL